MTRWPGVPTSAPAATSERELQADARAIRRWLAEGYDVYTYFNNDRHTHAVRNARWLADLVRQRGDRLRPAA